MGLFDIFKNKNPAPIQSQSNPIRDRAIQILGILTIEDKVSILKHRAIPKRLLNIFEQDQRIFPEVYDLVSKYYKLNSVT